MSPGKRACACSTVWPDVQELTIAATHEIMGQVDGHASALGALLESVLCRQNE
jgi:hypothetical protein